MLGGHIPNAQQNGSGPANLEADAEPHCTPRRDSTRLRERLDSTWTCTNSIIQGCSLSLLVAAAFSTIWVRVLEEGVLAVLCNSIVYDRRLCATGKEAPKLLQSAIQITSDFDGATGTRFNPLTSTCATPTKQMEKGSAANRGAVWR